MPVKGNLSVNRSDFESMILDLKNRNVKNLAKIDLAKYLGVSLSALDRFLQAELGIDYVTLIEKEFPSLVTRSREVTQDELTEFISMGINSWVEDNKRRVFKLSWDSIAKELKPYGMIWEYSTLRKKFKTAINRDILIVGFLKESYPEAYSSLRKDSFTTKNWNKLCDEFPSLNNNEPKVITHSHNESIDNLEFGDEQNLIFLYGLTVGMILAKNMNIPYPLSAKRSYSIGVDFVMDDGKKMEAKSNLSSYYSQSSNYDEADYVLCWKTGMDSSQLNSFQERNNILKVYVLPELWEEYGLFESMAPYVGNKEA
ncbi:TPA: hypothetical protein RQK43_004412 [Vibrio vulnificus]|uniref:hypothetical protein n=1 Tax=Vibrio parahaemolyticus TaxID=670 RepID=UPI0005F1C9C7|nr:hypothetical protein [Vibrio parahaemolyticus]EKO3808590.1 hypothetical protein [Vibrio harveyi]HDY7864611.1 hypothetical protein [Vibrio vulnificus]EGQ9245393.1 hypothetical protein [Vibrio parahaemolyticus]EGR1899372.1 hypothetical protein [Vibrio parahaemolyticus]EGR1922932.1 hypothetical protein [Vibrio parahaemolyticus]